MKIDGQKVKDERAGRGWSQQHLADASGLSLRTVQRVENLGVASSETLLALQATLETGLEEAESISKETPATPLINSPIALAGLLFATSFFGALCGAVVTAMILG